MLKGKITQIGGGTGNILNNALFDHETLYNRDAEKAHPITAIDGLSENLKELKDSINSLELRTNSQILATTATAKTDTSELVDSEVRKLNAHIAAVANNATIENNLLEEHLTKEIANLTSQIKDNSFSLRDIDECVEQQLVEATDELTALLENVSNAVKETADTFDTAYASMEGKIDGKADRLETVLTEKISEVKTSLAGHSGALEDVFTTLHTEIESSLEDLKACIAEDTVSIQTSTTEALATGVAATQEVEGLLVTKSSELSDTVTQTADNVISYVDKKAEDLTNTITTESANIKVELVNKTDSIQSYLENLPDTLDTLLTKDVLKIKQHVSETSASAQEHLSAKLDGLKTLIDGVSDNQTGQSMAFEEIITIIKGLLTTEDAEILSDKVTTISIVLDRLENLIKDNAKHLDTIDTVTTEINTSVTEEFNKLYNELKNILTDLGELKGDISTQIQDAKIDIKTDIQDLPSKLDLDNKLAEMAGQIDGKIDEFAIDIENSLDSITQTLDENITATAKQEDILTAKTELKSHLTTEISNVSNSIKEALIENTNTAAETSKEAILEALQNLPEAVNKCLTGDYLTDKTDKSEENEGILAYIAGQLDAIEDEIGTVKNADGTIIPLTDIILTNETYSLPVIKDAVIQTKSELQNNQNSMLSAICTILAGDHISGDEGELLEPVIPIATVLSSIVTSIDNLGTSISTQLDNLQTLHNQRWVIPIYDSIDKVTLDEISVGQLISVKTNDLFETFIVDGDAENKVLRLFSASSGGTTPDRLTETQYCIQAAEEYTSNEDISDLLGYNSVGKKITILKPERRSNRITTFSYPKGDGGYVYYVSKLHDLIFTSNGFSAGFELLSTEPITNGDYDGYYIYKSGQKLTDSVTITIN